MRFLLFLSQIFLLTKYLLLSRIFGPLGLVIGSNKIIPEHMEHVTHTQHCTADTTSWYWQVKMFFLSINAGEWRWTNYEGNYFDKIGTIVLINIAWQITWDFWPPEPGINKTRFGSSRLRLKRSESHWQDRDLDWKGLSFNDETETDNVCCISSYTLSVWFGCYCFCAYLL